MVRSSILLAGVAASGLLAPPLRAQESPTPIRGKEAGDIVIGASVIGVVPMNGGSVNVLGGTPDVSNSVTGQLDATYFMAANVAANLMLTTSRHDLEISDSRIGLVDLGHVWALPATLTFQYHMAPRDRFSPYVGVGLNYTAFYGEGGGYSRPFTSVDVRNAFGVAANAGFDVEMTPHWLLNLDVKWIYLQPEVTIQTPTRRFTGTAKVDPWIFGVGLRYRF